jgi:hypothetical protein
MKPEEDLLLSQFEFFWSVLSDDEAREIMVWCYENRQFQSERSYFAIDALAAMDEG